MSRIRSPVTFWGIIFTLDTVLAVVALGGSYVRMLSVIIPGASMIFGFAFSRIYLARYRSRFGTSAGHPSTSWEDVVKVRGSRLSPRDDGGKLSATL